VPPTSLVTAPWSYVRLHGRNAAAWFRPEAGRDARYDYHYAEDELDAWASRIEALRARTDLTVVVGNNHYDGQAMAAVLGLAHRLLGEPIPIPDTLRSRFPELESRAAPEPGSLFP
jgi:uncharacterized protein YecE (DUF72 family)